MKITELALENRPRERLAKVGPAALSTAELLAIILKSGTKKENALEISQKLLAKYRSNLLHCSLKELTQEHGLGQAKAAQIIALSELSKRLQQTTPSPKIRSAEDLAEIYLPRLQHLHKEHFLAVYLNTKNKIVADEIITIGILDASLVHPREVFSGAIKQFAHSLIIIHNHPSGNPEPSDEDLLVTEKIKEVGDLIGIPLLDHVILGKNSWWSWRESL